jgi:hypothetical protein
MPFKIFRRLAEGKMLEITWRHTREQADRFSQTLNEHWPGEYTVEEIADDPEPPIRFRPSIVAPPLPPLPKKGLF